MTPEDSNLTVSEALENMGLSPDPFLDAERQGKWWSFGFCGMTIPCYNFAWRRKALPYHDLHHVVTGYPLTMRGEMQVAAWEFSAGRFPSLFSNLFCLPLIGLALLCAPRRTYAAFVQGRRKQTLFGRKLPSDMRKVTIGSLQALTQARHRPPDTSSDLWAFTVICLCSIAEIALLAIPLGLMLIALVLACRTFF